MFDFLIVSIIFPEIIFRLALSAKIIDSTDVRFFLLRMIELRVQNIKKIIYKEQQIETKRK